MNIHVQVANHSQPALIVSVLMLVLLVSALGMSHGSFRMMWPGMDLRLGLRNMELFAERVLPHFK